MTGRCVWGQCGATGRDSQFLNLIKRASRLGLRQRFFHYEAERKRKVRERKRKEGGREGGRAGDRSERSDGESVRRLDSRMFCCY